jgi:hypothetical protein
MPSLLLLIIDLLMVDWSQLFNWWKCFYVPKVTSYLRIDDTLYVFVQKCRGSINSCPYTNLKGVWPVDLLYAVL